MNSVDRPSFFEGQLLAASDLELAVDYARETMERHAREAHTAGVVRGLNLTLHDGAAGGGAQDAFVTEGLAVDALGRQIVVTRTTPILADPLLGKPDGSYAVYAWLTEVPMLPSAGANPCTTVSERVRERANVAVLPDAAQAAGLTAVRLGTLAWSAAKNAFVAGPTAAGREGGGVRAHEIVAPEDSVVVHADAGDHGPTTFAVKGTVKAISADDGTRPIVRIPGGELQLCAFDTDPKTRTVTLGSASPTVTSNAMVVGLGNNDPKSALEIANPGGIVASIDGTGTVHAATGSFDNVNAAASVVVGAADNTLTLAATPPGGRIGVQATHTLPLQFGAAPGDQAMFVAGATPVVVIDQTTLTVTAKQLVAGAIDANAAGLMVKSTDPLELRTQQGDIVVNPGAGVPFLRFTGAHRMINQPLNCDVTPSTSTQGGVSILRMGPLAVMFGTTQRQNVNPMDPNPLTVAFQPGFTATPAFFVAAVTESLFTVSAVATHVDRNGASYRVVHVLPDAPNDGDNVSFSDDVVDVTVSWLALGTLP